MAEKLLLAHTVGRSGWEVAHAGGAGEFALAAVGQCFVQRRLLFNLPLLWRLRSLWRSGVASLDPRSLRVAMCVDRRVRFGGTRLDITVTTPVDDGGRPNLLVEATLPITALRERDPRLPAPEAGHVWRVHGLTPEGVKNFRPIARAIQAAQRNARVELRASARRSRTPGSLRSAFPLRIDLLFVKSEGYVTLVPLRELVLADD